VEQLALPAERVLVVDATDKALFSHPGAVLIDDYEKHRDPWEARGGIFIHYRSALESIALLEGALRHLGGSGALPPVWPAASLHTSRSELEVQVTRSADLLGLAKISVVSDDEKAGIKVAHQYHDDRNALQQ
jgi:hypothetical protein